MNDIRDSTTDTATDRVQCGFVEFSAGFDDGEDDLDASLIEEQLARRLLQCQEWMMAIPPR